MNVNNDESFEDAIARQNEQDRQKEIRKAALIRQAAQRQRMSASMNVLGGMTAVCDAGKRQREAVSNMKNDMLSSLCITARRNGGYVPQDALGYASRVLGKPITGCGFSNGNLVLTSPGTITDPKTGQRYTDNFQPFAVVDKFSQAMALQKSMLAPDMRGELIDLMVKDGYAPNELSARGLVDPRSVQPVNGGVVMGGGGPLAAPVSMRMRPATGNSSEVGPAIPKEGGWEATSNETAVPGPRKRHGGISVFSTNGTNKRVGTADEGFALQDFSYDHPANNRNDAWKQVSIGPSDTFDGKGDKSQIRVYENSATGERVRVKDGENLRDVISRSSTDTKKNGGAGVEIAKINADSREKVAWMKNETQKEIASQKEEGKNYRAELRDDQSWQKLINDAEKTQKDFAVKMKRAKTYEKRVELIGKSIDNEYEIQKKRVKNEEERIALDNEYKQAKLDLEQGKLDVDWFKAETAADQGQQKLDDDKANKEAERQLRLKIEEARRVANSGKTAVNPSRVKEINEELKALEKVIDNGTSEARKQAQEQIGVLMNEMRGDKGTIKTDDNSGEGPSKQEPPNGEYTKVKDGVSYHWGMSKNGEWGYFPDKKK